MTGGTRPTPGRPRSAAADKAILAATLRLLSEQGYAGMSIEGVAAAAGVGKTTIYRRYTDKIDLVAAAIASILSDSGSPPDSGDAKADLIEFLRLNLTVFRQGAVYSIVGSLLVEEERNPELFEIFRERAIFPRRRQLQEILERGIQRGQLRSGVHLDAAIEALVGALYARHISGLAETTEWLEGLVEVLWEGLSSQRRGAT